jgi:DNA-binding transcriptional ArsR family regulator
MPHHRVVDPELPGIFHALADPTRLAVVERLSVAPASATVLAQRFPMALPSFMQHMGVLERAGIVTSHKSGRTRTYQLAPGALQLAAAWLAEFRNHWERRLDQLDHLLVTTGHTSHTSSPTSSHTNSRPADDRVIHKERP